MINGATMQIGKNPNVHAEWALIAWYDADGKRRKPVAVELSYRYRNEDGEYGGGVTSGAFDVFNIIQLKLERWVDPNPMTKTAIVFG